MLVEEHLPTEENLQSFRVDSKQESIRIDKFLTQRVGFVTRSRLQKMIKEGFVMVGGKVVSTHYKVKPLDLIVLRHLSPPQPDHITPEDIPIDVVYEDAHLVVVNKAANRVVHPAHGNWTGTLLNALAHYFGQNETKKHPPRMGLLHRIDKGTSGLLVVAKTEQAVQHISQQFLTHSVARTYHALVWGVPEPSCGTITANLARHPKDRRLITTVPKYQGKHAITHYEVLRDFQNFSLLVCRLETGRTHQIRAHMKHIGHPIFNDEKYMGNKIWKGRITTKYKQFVKNCMTLLPRQALHAKTLGFLHPATGKQMLFNSELPADMQGVIDQCEAYDKVLQRSQK